MAASAEDLADLVGGLNIANDTHGVHSQSSNPSSSTQPTVQEAIQILIKSAEVTLTHVQQVHSLAIDATILSSLNITESLSLHKTAAEFAKIIRVLDDTANTLGKTIENSIVAHFSSLVGRSGVQKLLTHFDEEIRRIVRKVLTNSTDGDRALCKISEECYNQATNTSGTLHSDSYFIPREEAQLEWPYDPDYQSEEYYEHESRLEIDGAYAESWRQQHKRREEWKKKERQRWIGFWIDVLQSCLEGPTLFYPPAVSNDESFNFNLSDIPQYLFRTFDKNSSGRNDSNVIASVASVSQSSKNSRINILSLENRKAAEMLHSHLTKPCFGGPHTDNLMSWTSSLLFAIQYAIWRCHTGHCHPADIKICVVDTKQFPRGQFAQDIWLLQMYRDTAKEVGGETWRFFQFREKDERYYNGEYLSQGFLHHSGRSCVVTLKKLIDTGLHELYPEFADPSAMASWAKRVLELRQHWRNKQKTTHQEIRHAFQIAAECFSDFAMLDIMLMLLTFKNRKYQQTMSIKGEYFWKYTSERKPANNATENDKTINQYIPKWGSKPAELRRYLIAMKLINFGAESNGLIASILRRFDGSVNYRLFEEIFECT